MNQIYTKINDSRYLVIYNKKIKQIKAGVIMVMVILMVMLAAEVINDVSYKWIDFVIQNYYKSYQEHEISYEIYLSLKEELEFDQVFYEWICFAVSGTAKVLSNIGFIFIIVGLLSITTDRALNKKLRRVSLILSISLLIFVIYFIFEILLKDIEVIMSDNPYPIW